jgi:IPT/TIG domain
MLKKLFPAALLLLSLVACPEPPKPDPTKPVITAFTANPASLPTGGGTTQLEWQVLGAESLSIDQTVGVVTGVAKTVTVTTTTQYTLTATNAAGSSTATTTVTVAPVPPKPFNQLVGTIAPWTRGARVVRAEGFTGGALVVGTGNLEANGNFLVDLSEPDAGTLTAFGTPSSCGSSYTVTPGNLKGQGFTNLKVFTTNDLLSGTLIQSNTANVSSRTPGTKFASFLFADRDATITADCTLTGGDTKLNLALKRGWNPVLVEYQQNNVTQYTTASSPIDVVWRFIPASGGKVTITNAPGSLEVGASVTLNATVTEPDGTPINAPQLTWTSTSPEYVGVDANGTVVAKQPTLYPVTINVALTNAPGTGTSASIAVYGFSAAGGTFKREGQSLGTAVRLRYLNQNGTGASQPVPFTITGPAGWNGGASLSGTYPTISATDYFGLPYVFTSDVAAVSGTYTIKTDSPPAALRTQSSSASVPSLFFKSPIQYPASPAVVQVRPQGSSAGGTTFTIDTATQIAVPQNVRLTSVSDTQVTLEWTAESNRQYEVEVYDQTSAIVVRNKSSAYAPAYLSNLSLDRTHTYEFRVYARTNEDPNQPFAMAVGKTLLDFSPVVTALDATGGGTAGGNTLTISGFNFDIATRVFFGNTEATSKALQGSSTLQVSVPAGAVGTVDVILQNARGSSLVSSKTKFTYFNVSQFDVKTPTRLTSGNNGYVHFVEYDPWATTNMILAKADTAGSITRIPLTNVPVFGVQDIALDSTGLVWLALTDRLIRVNANGTLQEVMLPGSARAAMIAFGADGNLWVARTDAFKLTRMKPDGTAATEFTPVNSSFSSFNSSGEMLLAPDGNVWFTSTSSYGRVTSSGEITTFQGYNTSSLSVFDNALWGANYGGLVKIGNDGLMTTWSNGCGGRVAKGSDTAVWCSGNNYYYGAEARLNRVVLGATPDASVSTVILLPAESNSSSVAEVTADSNGRIWYLRGSKLGVLQP